MSLPVSPKRINREQQRLIAVVLLEALKDFGLDPEDEEDLFAEFANVIEGHNGDPANNFMKRIKELRGDANGK